MSFDIFKISERLLGRPSGVAECCCGSGARTRQPGERKQLLVDVSVIHRHDAQSGIQRVVRALLLQLTHFEIPDFDVRPVFATKAHAYHYADSDFLTRRRAANEGDKNSSPVLVSQGDVFLGLDLATYLLPKYQWQIACWKAHGVSLQILIYDLLPILQGQWFRSKTRRHFMRWFKFVSRQADRVICISDQVAIDYQKALTLVSGVPRPAPSVRTIGLSGDLRNSEPSTGFPTDYHMLAKTLETGLTALMVGTIEPRKGYSTALAAFDVLWKQHPEEQLRLVIVGRPGWKTAALQRTFRRHPESGKRFFWLNDASDECLQSLYKLSSGTLVTSYAEGYGLPVMEACAHGKRVLARDIPVFREFGNANIHFFNDDSPKQLATAIFDWLHMKQERRHPVDDIQGPGWDVVRRDLLCALGVAAHVNAGIG